MVLNLYHEARGEPLKGKQLVVQVVINRTFHSDKFGRTFCETIKEYKQFSWTLDIAKAYSLHSNKNSISFSEYSALREVVQGVLSSQNKVLDSEKELLYYHNTSVLPPWSKRMKLYAVVGKHKFYAIK